MAMLQLKRMPDDLHEALRRRAASENLTMSDLVIQIIRTELALPSRSSWLAAVREGWHTDTPRIDGAAVIDAVRQTDP